LFKPNLLKTLAFLNASILGLKIKKKIPGSWGRFFFKQLFGIVISWWRSSFELLYITTKAFLYASRNEWRRPFRVPRDWGGEGTRKKCWWMERANLMSHGKDEGRIN
jgi:hypothetical protein